MITAAFFQFLRDLKANNRRDWFQEQKWRYERDVRQPLLEQIESLAGPLEELSPHFVADKSSLFRPHRDTRFSADKSPYKLHAAAQFRHERGKDAHAPGFYLHLEPGQVFVGGGLWRPEAANLARVRDAIVAWPQRWQEARQCGTLEGESLKRPPRGYDPEHAYGEDLKRKDFVTMTTFTEEQACDPGFSQSVLETFARMQPLLRFLCHSLDLPY